MTMVFGKQPDMVGGIRRFSNRGYSGHLQRAQWVSRVSVGLQINEWLGEKGREYRRVKGALWASGSMSAPLAYHY